MQNNIAKRFVLIVATLLLVAIALFLWFHHHQQHQVDLKAAVQLDTQAQPSIGSAKAPINITAFEDLKCINCKIFNQSLLPKIIARYVTPGIARYHMVTLNIIPHSAPAANAALCLHEQKQAYFFDFVHYVFANQPNEASDWATPANLLQMASHAIPTANFTQLSQCMLQNKYQLQIDKNMQLAKKAMGKHIATPTLFINGIHVSPLSLRQVDNIIQQIRHA